MNKPYYFKNTKLLKTWIIWGVTFNKRNKYNVSNILFFKKNDYFLNIKKIITSVRKIYPLLLDNTKKDNNYILLTSKYIYLKTIKKFNENDDLQTVKKYRPAIFTNFKITSYFSMRKTNIHDLPTMLIFFHLHKLDSIIIDSKRKKLPTIALTNIRKNANLIDYKIILNNTYFNAIYFFSRLIFKILLLKNY